VPGVCGKALECAENLSIGGVKFLVDAQLPLALARWLRQQGHDAVHTLELPDRNRTKDSTLLQLAKADGRTLVTKDGDFQLTFELGKGPPKLLLVSTGNIANRELLNIFERNERAILAELQGSDFIELNRGAMIVHR
jgi:predicted nuclease of predicted toxin-antitoxin system